ncbi:MAG: phosphatidate cytidylyltransferase [Gammaproteobacteria bacterium]|nr:phosphatidate cytidylyltransferase [Gammaproteobacteria bacterium]
MLKQRIVTAAILIALLVAALFYFPIGWMAVLFGLFIAAAGWEWATLSGLKKFSAKIVYVIGLLIFGVLGMIGVFQQPHLVLSFFLAATLWWIWIAIDIFSRTDFKRGMFTTFNGKMVGGFLVLVPSWIALVYLLAQDLEAPRTLLYMFVLVWVADSAAYFTGSFFGKHKLAPQISPGKTWEGVLGGIIGAVLLAWLCGTMVWNYDAEMLLRWIGLAGITGLVSVIGDLTESKLKRIAKVKDSGKWLPGHGGVLDRIDALTAAAPVFVLGTIVLKF